jgi:hypothetical protein
LSSAVVVLILLNRQIFALGYPKIKIEGAFVGVKY